MHFTVLEDLASSQDSFHQTFVCLPGTCAHRHCSCIIYRASEYSGRWTFGELIRYFFGRTGSWALRLFIFINNLGEETCRERIYPLHVHQPQRGMQTTSWRPDGDCDSMQGC